MPYPLVGGLEADRIYDLELAGSNLASGEATAPGVPLLSQQVRANKHGVVQVISGAASFPASSRMRAPHYLSSLIRAGISHRDTGKMM
jgi:hypothetical protein